MIAYKLNSYLNKIINVTRLQDMSIIPFDPANTDYQQFKRDVDGGAELQDADGNLMTAEEAKNFIKELP